MIDVRKCERYDKLKNRRHDVKDRETHVHAVCVIVRVYFSSSVESFVDIQLHTEQHTRYNTSNSF